MKSASSVTTWSVHVILLLLAVCLLYLNTLASPFVLDDSQIFENNPSPVTGFSWADLKKVATSRFHPQRMLPNLSLAVNHAMSGTDVTGYHWFNIAVHAAAAVTVYFLLQTVLALTGRHREVPLGRETAFAAAMLWAVHPLQTNAVTYIIQRMTSMAALFYLLSVLCYLRARMRGSLYQGKTLFALAAVFGIMALFSKENTAVLPLTLLGCELFFFQGERFEDGAAKRHLLFAGTLVAGFVLIILLLLGTDPLSRILAGYEYRDFTLEQRLLTQPRVVFLYLGLLVLPLPTWLNIAYDYPVSTGLLSPPQTLLAIAGLLGLAAVVVFLHKRDRLSAFAVFWFLVNLSIESSFIPLMLVFEHRMYLPSVMLVAAAVAWCYRLAGDNVRLARWGLACVIVLFGLFTWQRNSVWQSEVSLWSDVVSKSPGLAWAHANLGRAYAEKGEVTRAEQHLRKAIDLNPDNGLAYLNLGVMYEKQDMLYEANLMLNRALDTKLADPAVLLSNLALVSFKLGRYDEAVRYAERSIELKPYRYSPYEILGTAWLKTGNLWQAESVYLSAIREFPQKGDPYIRLASVYEKQNRLDEARKILHTALSLKDINPVRVYNQLGIVSWRMNNLPESVNYAQKALELDPGFLDAYLTLGISYEDAGRPDLAFSQFRIGWQRGLDMVGIYNNWAQHQLANKNPDRAIIYLQEAVSLEPGRPESHRNLARAYAMKGLAAEAERENQIAGELESARK